MNLFVAGNSSKMSISKRSFRKVSRIELNPCIFRWNWLVLNIPEQRFGFCCKTPTLPLPQMEFFEPDILGQVSQIRESRSQQLRGEWDTACSHCRGLENSGVISPRQSWEGSEKFLQKKAAGIEPGSSMTLEIVLDDLCNLECTYCGPSRSTRWQSVLGCSKSEEAGGPLFEKFINWLGTTGISFHEIQISGGEPLLSRRLPELVRVLGERLKGGDQKPRVSLISNLSLPPERFRQAIDLLSPLSEVSDFFLEFSNESLAQRAEYIRFGLNFKWFAENLNWTLAEVPNIHLGAQMTLNALSVSDLPNYLGFLQENSSRYSREIFPIVNLVSDPEYLNVNVLTEGFSEYLNRAAEMIEQARQTGVSSDWWFNYKEFLTSLAIQLQAEAESGELARKRRDLVEYIEALDTRRGTDFIKTFPEYSLFFDQIQS